MAKAQFQRKALLQSRQLGLTAETLPGSIPGGELAESRRGEVQLKSGELGLHDWLRLSWFYPDGFQSEEILETKRSWLVLGNGIAYKFLKSQDSPGEPARDRWARSCQELSDNSPLASAVYLGLRCLQQDEGELVWESRARSSQFRPSRMPRQVHDVALVLRRLAREERLDEILRHQSEPSRVVLRRLSEVLTNFHQKQAEKAARDVLPTPERFLSLTEERHIHPLRDFLLRSSASLDPISLRGFEELLNALSRSLSRYLEVFRHRLERKHVVDCHRNIHLHTTFLIRDEVDSRLSPVVLARQLPEAGERYDDCLYDVASLAVDLERSSDLVASENFEDEYFNRFPESYDPVLYNFFKSAVCVEQLRKIWTSEISYEEGDLMERSEKLLALALKLTHGMHRPALVFFRSSGKSQAPREELPRLMANLIGGEHLCDEDVTPAILSESLPSDFIARRILNECRQLLESGKQVIVESSSLSWLSETELAELLKNFPFFQCWIQGLEQRPVDEETNSPSPHLLRLAFLSDSFSLIEQIFMILQELRYKSQFPS